MRTRQTDPMDRYDFVIIGAGPGGEAAANKARELGASVAIVDSPEVVLGGFSSGGARRGGSLHRQPVGARRTVVSGNACAKSSVTTCASLP